MAPLPPRQQLLPPLRKDDVDTDTDTDTDADAEAEAETGNGVDAEVISPLDEAQAIDDVAEIERLAALSEIEYDRVREAEAAKFGCRVKTLDVAVLKARKAAQGSPTAQGSTLQVDDTALWPEEVPGGILLDAIVHTIHQYVIIDEAVADAVGLWTVGTHAVDAAQFATRLYIHSPTKRCGKTTLLMLIGRLVDRPLPGSNISPSALFRVIEASHPTLILDEADTFVLGSEEMRGLLDCGHSRELAFVIRNVSSGDDFEARRFNTFAMIAIACKGKRLPDTVEDRSIGVPMARRKRGTPKPPRLPRRRPDGILEALQQKIARWAQDNLLALMKDEEEPKELPDINDRALDNWELLFRIADLAGPEWSKRARVAARKLSGNDSDEQEGDENGILLLEDVRHYFDVVGKVLSVTSDRLVGHLTGLEERPWSEWGKTGKAISKNQVARLLRQFGITSSQIWDGEIGRNLKGYVRTHLEDAFERYLTPSRPPPPNSASQSASPLKSAPNKEKSSVSQSARKTPPSGSKSARNPITTGSLAPSGSKSPKTGGDAPIPAPGGELDGAFEYEPRWASREEFDAQCARRYGMSLEEWHRFCRERSDG